MENLFYHEGAQRPNRLPREVGDAPAGVQGALDDTVSNILKVLVSPEVVRQLGLDDL